MQLGWSSHHHTHHKPPPPQLLRVTIAENCMRCISRNVQNTFSMRCTIAESCTSPCQQDLTNAEPSALNKAQQNLPNKSAICSALCHSIWVAIQNKALPIIARFMELPACLTIEGLERDPFSYKKLALKLYPAEIING